MKKQEQLLINEKVLEMLNATESNFKNVSLIDRYEIMDIYNEIVKGNKPEFINGKCKEILDKCGIGTIECGIGWKVL